MKIKELEWKYTERTTMTYTASDDVDVLYYIDQSFGSDSYYFTTVCWPEAIIYYGDDLPSAKTAAQQHYDRRIRAALSEPLTKSEVQILADQIVFLEERLSQYSKSNEPICWVYEDELPKSLSTEAYNALYPHSKVDGVRLFPVFGPALSTTLQEPVGDDKNIRETAIRECVSITDRNIEDGRNRIAVSEALHALIKEARKVS